eukprot:jgi/Chlat1/7221/Chrsp57S06867
MMARPVGGVSLSLKLEQRTQIRSVAKPILPCRETTLRSSLKLRHAMTLQSPEHGAPDSDSYTLQDLGRMMRSP